MCYKVFSSTLCKRGLLSNVKLPNRIQSIALETFSDCSSLEKIIIPDSVVYIESAAFSNCTNLAEVELPCGLKDIGSQAFSGTKWLMNQGDFFVVNGVLLSYSGKDSKVIIPDSVIAIGDCAFSNNTEVKCIVL